MLRGHVDNTTEDLDETRVRFGRALVEARKLQGVKQEELAERLGVTQSAVSFWENGRGEPSRADVFRIEDILHAQPGALSRILGYLPVTANTEPCTFERFLAEDRNLTETGRQILRGVYREVVTMPNFPDSQGRS
jgi:transcriptional regulator with XRE-family HTH domain